MTFLVKWQPCSEDSVVIIDNIYNLLSPYVCDAQNKSTASRRSSIQSIDHILARISGLLRTITSMNGTVFISNLATTELNRYRRSYIDAALPDDEFKRVISSCIWSDLFDSTISFSRDNYATSTCQVECANVLNMIGKLVTLHDSICIVDFTFSKN